MTIEQLQAQRDQIVTEMSRAQTTTVDGRTIVRRPIKDLEIALQRIDSEIAALTTGSRIRIHRIVCSQ